MLKLLASLLSGRQTNKLLLREPAKPSQERLNHYNAELELLKLGSRDVPTDPHEMVPVPYRAVFRDGEYFGHPLNSFCVSAEDIIPFLEVHRDQSLWLSVVAGLNYDLAITFDIVDWILGEPDCDALNAVKAFGCLDGSYFCGKTMEDRHAENSQELRALRRITEREKAGKHYIAELEYDARAMNKVTPGDLLEAARESRNRLTANERSILEIPEVTLLAGGTGAKSVEHYCVEEDYILVLSRGQAAVLG